VLNADLANNGARLIRLRWLAALAILIATPATAFLLRLPLPVQALMALGIIILAYNAILHWISTRPDARWDVRSVLVTGQIAFDWLALAAFVHLTGGIESPALLFFLFHVLLAEMLLPARAAYGYAALALLVVAGLATLEAIGVLPHYDILSGLAGSPLYTVGLLSFFGITVLVTASLVVPIVRDLRERERQITLLYESIQTLSSSLELSQVLNHLAQGITTALQAKAASIRLLDQSGKQLQIAAAYGLSQRYLDKGPVEVAASRIDQEALRGRAVVVETADDAYFQYPSDVHAEGIHAVLCVALSGRRSPLGVLRVYSDQPGFFTAKDADFVTAIARQGAMALENAMTYGELRKMDEVKSQFVRAVTHELRAPVAASQSLLRAVTHDLAGGLNDLQRDVLNRLSERLDALQALINDLLDLAAGKVEGLEGVLAPVSLEPVLTGVILRLSGEAEEREIALQLERQASGVAVMATEQGLERIFMNLIGNAVKYTPAGGKVRITLQQHNDGVVITVADTGMGIPEGDLPHLFEEFFRAGNAKRSGITGTGLGLAIVKNLIDRYQGRIAVQSELGKGTTFTVSLPRAG
jgi:signal transduction histidine kinase